MPDDFRLPMSYREVAAAIIAAIDAGRWLYGDKLPSAHELSTEYGVSVATIHRAMALLAESGDVTGRQGLGRFVTRR